VVGVACVRWRNAQRLEHERRWRELRDWQENRPPDSR
jgi:hypothetical protein